MANEKPPVSHESMPPLERRSNERVTSVYRPVLIETEEFAGFCLVRNISAGGMMGSVFAQLAEHEPLTVTFHPDWVVDGRVTWSNDGDVGIQFDQEINVEDLLRRVSEARRGTRINRAPRLQIECDARVVLDGRPIPIRLRDISQKGMKIEAGFLKPNDEVVVHLIDLEPHKAIVRWTQGGLAGLNFVRPLAFEELARWVIQRQFGHVV
jgi:hypothetical protein